MSPLDGVNGVRRNLLARMGLAVGRRVSGARGRRGSAALSLSTHNLPLAIRRAFGLLAAVDVVRRARECCVAHDVNGQRLDVSRSDDAPDGQRRAQLVAPLVEIVAED